MEAVMKNPTRMAWVDVAKGLSIILVVLMYSAYNTGKYTGEIGFLHYVIGFATPLRMPEFFLISGLFLSQVIARPWRRYADRRVVHYFYFYGLWALIMIGLKVGTFAHAPGEMARELALAVVEPYGVLWFIYLLGVFGVVTKLLWQFKVPVFVVVPLAAILQMAGVQSPSYAVTQFCTYFAYYYIGFVAAPIVFRVVEWAQKNVVAAIGLIAVWAVVNGMLVYSPGYRLLPDETQMGLAANPQLHFALALVGTLAVCVIAGLLSRLSSSMEWLRWLGEHSLVVYVAFTLPMSIFRAAAMKTGLLTQTGPLSLAVLVVSIVSPIVLYFIVQKTGYGGFLFERPAWARIVKDAPSAEAGRRPAAGAAIPVAAEGSAGTT
jgi:uncharacterized membrane protein YcfT